MVCWNWL